VTSYERVSPVNATPGPSINKDSNPENFVVYSDPIPSPGKVLAEINEASTDQNPIVPVSQPETKKMTKPTVSEEQDRDLTPTSSPIKKEKPQAIPHQTVVISSSATGSKGKSHEPEPDDRVKNLQISTPGKKNRLVLPEKDGETLQRAIMEDRRDSKTFREIKDLLPVMPAEAASTVTAVAQTKLVIGNLTVEVTGTEPEKMPQPKVTERIIVHHKPVHGSLLDHDSALKIKYGLGQL